MNCRTCPHMKAIQKALAPCQVCDAGKLHGQVSTDAAPQAELVYAHAKMSDHTTSSGVTNLAPDAEDSLRKAMASLFALDPVELLLVQHVIKGGSYANFCNVLWPMLRRLRTKERELCGKKDGFRSLAHSWAKRVEDKMPQMRDVLRARIELT